MVLLAFAAAKTHLQITLSNEMRRTALTLDSTEFVKGDSDTDAPATIAGKSEEEWSTSGRNSVHLRASYKSDSASCSIEADTNNCPGDYSCACTDGLQCFVNPSEECGLFKDSNHRNLSVVFQTQNKFCKIINGALSKIDWDSINIDLPPIQQKIPLLGVIDLNITGIQFTGPSSIDCAVETKGVVSELRGSVHFAAGLKNLDWSFRKESWPHDPNNGYANANLDMSFDLGIDVKNKEVTHDVIKLNDFDLKVHAKRHTLEINALVGILKPIVQNLLPPILQSIVEKAINNCLQDPSGCLALPDRKSVV